MDQAISMMGMLGVAMLIEFNPVRNAASLLNSMLSRSRLCACFKYMHML